MQPSPDTRSVIEVFFDGVCPLCRREITLLRRLDRLNRIRFTDIAAADFDAKGVGVDLTTLMAQIHGRLPGGELVTGVEVFRRLYEAVGFERLVAFSRLPVISSVLGGAYAVFSKNRLRLTGGCEHGTCDFPRKTRLRREAGTFSTVINRSEYETVEDDGVTGPGGSALLDTRERVFE